MGLLTVHLPPRPTFSFFLFSHLFSPSVLFSFTRSLRLHVRWSRPTNSHN